MAGLGLVQLGNQNNLPLVGALVAQAHEVTGLRPLSQFLKNEEDKPCYDRDKQPQTAATDLHLHPQPFRGNSLPYQELMGYLEQNEVCFALLYGIGQTLPHDSECTYYLDCVGTHALPSIKNDFENAANYVEYPQENVHVALSMTFPDLANPEGIVDGIKLLDAEYPGLFQWMGEVNLHKEALRGNGHEPASFADIARWKDFMSIFQQRGIPMAIHSDLGEDGNPTQNVERMEEVLRLYPNNKIVWMHMGLSRELVEMDPEVHIQLMSDFLDENLNLSLDISWTVIAALIPPSEIRKAFP